MYDLLQIQLINANDQHLSAREAFLLRLIQDMAEETTILKSRIEIIEKKIKSQSVRG